MTALSPANQGKLDILSVSVQFREVNVASEGPFYQENLDYWVKEALTTWYGWETIS